MIISDKQALVMFEVLKDSLALKDNRQIFSITYEAREKLVNQIINQQNEELIDLGNK